MRTPTSSLLLLIALAAVPATVLADADADRFLSDVEWLADDAREGRGVGTQGLAASADWLEAQFKSIGLEPAGENGTYRQRFDAVTDVERGPETTLSINGTTIPADAYMIPGFSGQGSIEAPVVFAGWGIDSADHGIQNYEGLDVDGKAVIVRRFTPTDGEFESDELQRRLGDIRYKAFKAREHGAVALIVADLAGEEANRGSAAARDARRHAGRCGYPRGRRQT